MTLAESIRDKATEIIQNNGYDIYVYMSPSRSLSSEGTSTITKGVETSAKAVFFTEDGSIVTEMEGVVTYNISRIYLKYNIGTITAESILNMRDEYYKITYMDKHPLGNIPITYYELVVEKLQDQEKVS